MTDLVLGVGQAIVSDLHRDITRQQTVPQSQVTGDRGNHGKIVNIRFLYSWNERHCRKISYESLNISACTKSHLLHQHDVCSGDKGSPPATKSLMLESVSNTQAAPGYCSRKQTGWWWWNAELELLSEYPLAHLWVKLCLCRCSSPDAMSHAICWRTKGSGVMFSAVLQLWR